MTMGLNFGINGYFVIVIATDQQGRTGHYVRIMGANHKIVWVTPGFYADIRAARAAIAMLGFNPEDTGLVRVVDERDKAATT